MPDAHDTETLAEVLAAVMIQHQRIPTYSGDGGNRCVGCDNLAGESDGSNSPRHVAHVAAAQADAIAARIVQARAGEGALREACVLEPAENMALTVAWAQVERGEHPMGNVAAVCVMALERIRRAAMPSIAEGPA